MVENNPPFFIILLLFMFIINLFIVSCNGDLNKSFESEPCPDKCSCLGGYADCSQQNLKKLPSDVPKWVTQM